MAENRADLEPIVPQGGSTLSDGDLGMRVPSTMFEGAPSGAVVVDTAEQKRLRQFHPVSVEELLEGDQDEEYYCGTEDESEVSNLSDDEYDMTDGFVVPIRKTASLFSSSESEDEETRFYEEEEGEEDVFPQREKRPRHHEEEEVVPQRRKRSRHCEEEESSVSEEEERERDRDRDRDREDICPLCFYGNTEFDKIACEKADAMWKLLATSFFSLTSTRMCAYVCYAQYYEEWYLPSHKRARKAGHSNHLPKWSVDGMYAHITEHMGDPRIYLGTTIERLRKLESLLNRFCFEKNGEGMARPNLSVINQARMMSKHIIDLYKTEPREMFGYCESWEANPKDISRFVNLTRCKVGTRTRGR
jgi:hypothetical protein